MAVYETSRLGKGWMNNDGRRRPSALPSSGRCIKFGEKIVHILILTLALNRTMPATMATAEFSSRTSCEEAALAWKTQARITFNTPLLTAVYKPH